MTGDKIKPNRNMLRAVQRTLTIFFHLYFCSLVLPEDSGWRRTDDITNNIGIVSFSKLLGRGGVCEGDSFWNITCKTRLYSLVFKYESHQNSISFT